MSAAEHTMIETMAQAIMEARNPEFGHGSGCRVIDWKAEARDNPHVAQAIAQARAALRSLLQAGPTEAMVEAGWQESWKRNDSDTSCTPRDLFAAMLSAALEEDSNA